MATAIVFALAVSGCGILRIGTSEARELAEINVTSPSLRDDAPLPTDYSCKGSRGSPPLRWSSEPLPDVKSIAIVVDDHDGAEPAVHWVLYNIPARTTELGENAENLPAAAVQASVTSGKPGYDPPCNRTGTYRFSVYALNGLVTDTEGASLSVVLKKIADQTIARGRLTAVHIE